MKSSKLRWNVHVGLFSGENIISNSLSVGCIPLVGPEDTAGWHNNLLPFKLFT